MDSMAYDHHKERLASLPIDDAENEQTCNSAILLHWNSWSRIDGVFLVVWSMIIKITPHAAVSSKQHVQEANNKWYKLNKALSSSAQHQKTSFRESLPFQLIEDGKSAIEKILLLFWIYVA